MRCADAIGYVFQKSGAIMATNFKVQFVRVTMKTGAKKREKQGKTKVVLQFHWMKIIQRRNQSTLPSANIVWGRDS